ncbi:hypothetical protein [Salipiger mucosus]|uniref:Uncharacterized protein n=1 Tax=Salipiger mucosus DSM 16094 TaxID=1123237 RepID=S9QVJ6_9RHOB|nr:hypothetical protein [Salipiger mucosus]EPX83572.1 hypothetical protein Salmuc_02180 [Salipiger mucosus DSM 16094]
MRAGRGSVLEVTVHGERFDLPEVKRVKDRSGSWKSTNQRARRAGASALVYLNRYEGVTTTALERILEIGSDKVDRMSDAKLRKLVPELEDSWVILDPAVITIERVLTPDDPSPECPDARQLPKPPGM